MSARSPARLRSIIWVLLLGLPAPSAHSEAVPSPPAAGALATRVAELEYRASPAGSGLQAPNRVHGFRTWFGPRGIRVVERSGPAPASLQLWIRGIGRPGALVEVTEGEVVASGTRVEIRRPGLTEWYANSPAGLEQGFVVQRPPGSGEGPLVLDLQLVGARALSLEGELRLVLASGRMLSYGRLHARDASERPLAASMSRVGDDRIWLRIDDAGAVYPIVVDPLLSATADAVIEGNQVSMPILDGGHFGESVGWVGDVNGDGHADLAVASRFYNTGVGDGIVAIFHGGPGGVGSGDPGSADATLTPPPNGGVIGPLVAGAGDVNGDGYDDVIAKATLGGVESAVIFHGGPGGISSGTTTLADSVLESSVGSFFGSGFAAGDVNGDGYGDVIVGHMRYSGGETDEGAAWIWHGGAGGIADGDETTADTKLEGDQVGALFGSATELADVNGDGYDDAVVGARFYDAPSHDEGAVFVFHGGAAGIADGSPATADTQIESDDNDGHLGTRLATGDVNGDGYADLVLGTPDFGPGMNQSGAVFVYHGRAGGIPDGDPAAADTELIGEQQDGKFGDDVASGGDLNGDGYADVVVGDIWYDGGGGTLDGGVFVYLGGAGGIPDGGQSTAYPSIDMGQAGSEFGRSASLEGDGNGDGYADLAFSAHGYDAGESDEGAVFVFHGGAEGVSSAGPAEAHAAFDAVEAGAMLGAHVAGAGDVNGDGYADVIVGAPFFDGGESDEGAAFVFLGGSGGLEGASLATAHVVLESDQVGARFGASVAGAGDVNGDGYADVIVGATHYDDGDPDEGAAFLFHGSAGGIVGATPLSAASQLTADQAGAELGTRVSGAGDVNGDGYADVVVGAPLYDSGESDEGAAFVFHGGAGGIASGGPGSAGAQLESDQVDARLGSSVAGAGDVNGDGYADLVVGAPLYDAGESDEGVALVFLGSAGGIVGSDPATAHARLESDQVGAELGRSVAGAGDVDRDAFSDVIVGAPLYTSGESEEGAAFVLHGSAGGIATGGPGGADTRLESDQAGARLGAAVAGAGDVNADGYADVIVGAPLYDAGEADEGGAFVFAGGSGGIAATTPATASAIVESDEAGAELGASVAGVADLNGDGAADVLVGAAKAGANDAGRVLAFVGNGDGDGRIARARQRRTDASLAQPWAISDASDGFMVELDAASPLGRRSVKLEVEACPAGAAFGSALCTSHVGASWTDSTLTGVVLSETLPGLSSGLHRWRARVLYAPLHVTEPGIVAPPHPAHGPWRRPTAQAREADMRTLPEPAPGLTLALGAVLVVALSRRRR